MRQFFGMSQQGSLTEAEHFQEKLPDFGQNFYNIVSRK